MDAFKVKKSKWDIAKEILGYVIVVILMESMLIMAVVLS